MNIKKLKTAYTHNGFMHADDVFASALLKILSPNINIVRINRGDINKYKNEFLFDIGNGQFDHHEEEKIKRDNGTPYASFGLLMKEYYPLLGLNEEYYKKLDKDFIELIDKVDNGYQEESITSPISLIINSMNQINIKSREQEEAFIKAVNLAHTILLALLNKYLYYQKISVKIKKIISENPNSKYLVLDEFLSYDLFRGSQIQFIIFRDIENNYAIVSTNSKQYKINDTIQEDRVFVHSSRFMGVYKTLNTAEKVAKLSLVYNKKYNKK